MVLTLHWCCWHNLRKSSFAEKCQGLVLKISMLYIHYLRFPLVPQRPSIKPARSLRIGHECYLEPPRRCNASRVISFSGFMSVRCGIFDILACGHHMPPFRTHARLSPTCANSEEITLRVGASFKISVGALRYGTFL